MAIMYNGRSQAYANPQFVIDSQTYTAGTSSNQFIQFQYTTPNTSPVNVTSWHIQQSNTGGTAFQQWSVPNQNPWSIQINGTATWEIIDPNNKLFKVKDALMKIFKKPDPELLKELTDDEKKLFKAKEVSEKLLKEWLSPEEYNGLKLQGEIHLPSKTEPDCLFIVKRDPNQMVEVRKNGKYSHRLCVVARDGDMPVGDQLLSKLLLLKNDEKKFIEVAIRHG